MRQTISAADEAADLTRLQTSESPTLVSTCAISRPARTSNSAGGSTTVYSTPNGMGALACAIDIGRHTHHLDIERDIASEIRASASFMLHLPPGTDVRPDDRVIIFGLTLEIVSIPAPLTAEGARLIFVLYKQG